MASHYVANSNRVLLVYICHQKRDYANYDQVAPNFDVAYKTIQRVFSPDLKLFGPTKTTLQTKELG